MTALLALIVPMLFAERAAHNAATTAQLLGLWGKPRCVESADAWTCVVEGDDRYAVLWCVGDRRAYCSGRVYAKR